MHNRNNTSRSCASNKYIIYLGKLSWVRYCVLVHTALQPKTNIYFFTSAVTSDINTGLLCKFRTTASRRIHAPLTKMYSAFVSVVLIFYFLNELLCRPSISVERTVWGKDNYIVRVACHIQYDRPFTTRVPEAIHGNFRWRKLMACVCESLVGCHQSMATESSFLPAQKAKAFP